MKAVWYDRTGPAREVLVYGDIETPQAKAGEVRIRLEAAGVNPSDTYRRAGTSYRPMEYPRIITCSDGAGMIDQIGDGVTRFSIGQRVWLYNGQRDGRAFGTAAQYIALNETLVSPLPDNASFAEGATLGIPGLTAWYSLFCDGPIKGQTVLVTGGAGAVGHYAVQLAKWGGAKVIATVSSESKSKVAKEAGADLVINYKIEDVAKRVIDYTGGHGVDRISEVDFGGNLEVSMKICAMNATISTYATRSNPKPAVNVRDLMTRDISLRPFTLPNTPERLRLKGQEQLTLFLVGGRRIHNVSATFPLARTAQAHEAVEAGAKLGTVVVECAK